MRYRTNKRTGDRVSEIGIGSSYMYEAGAREAVRALRRAVEGGINYFDLAAGDGTTFAMYGEALRDLREDVYLQVHFGADYSRGTYGWTLSLEAIKRSVDRQLRELRTDYIDYGFIHCQDEVSDWEPCPAGIDIGLVNKYYDLAKAGDGIAREHYRGLARNASDCLHCGHCDGRCPFSVPQSGRMRMISDYMGAR